MDRCNANGTHAVIGDRFEIADLERDLLGRGGVGDVYRGTDLDTGRHGLLRLSLPRLRAASTTLRSQKPPSKSP